MNSDELTLKKSFGERSHSELFLVLIVIFSATYKFATFYMALASVAYFIMVAGLIYRKNKQVHYKLMTAAILLDLSLVGILEFQRHAIKTALSFTLTPLQQCHIGVSSVATAFYIPILILGYKRLKGRGTLKTRKAHMTLGIAAFVFRSLGFLLMFSMLTRHYLN